MKIGHFGSCLSADPTAHLVADFGCEEAFRIHHNRSDQFVRYFIEKSSEQLEFDWLKDFLKLSDAVRTDVMTLIENQYAPWLGYENTLRGNVNATSNFFDDIQSQKVDIILLDNFMDTVSCLLHRKEQTDKTVFFPAHLCENKEQVEAEFVMNSYLTPQESAENWLKIYKFFRLHQPEAKIFFTCWSHSTSRGNEERFDRIVGFYECFSELAAGEDIHIIPPLDVPNELTNGPEDWYHMAKPVYKALAGYIFLKAAGGLPASGKMKSWSRS